MIEAENNQSFAAAQLMTGSPSIVGAITTSTDNDWYSIDVIAPGSSIAIETRTPGDAGGSVNNLLDPVIELYSPENVLLASGVALTDGRNESIQTTAPVSGRYRVRVTSGNATQGEYLLDARVDSLTSTSIINRQVFYNRSTSSVLEMDLEIPTTLSIQPNSLVTRPVSNHDGQLHELFAGLERNRH